MRFLVSVVARGVLAGTVPILPRTVPFLPYVPPCHRVTLLVTWLDRVGRGFARFDAGLASCVARGVRAPSG